MRILLLPALVTLALVAPARAETVKAGDLSIENAWARATPKGSSVGAGYLVIRNDGASADRLTGARADFATVQMHEMKMDKDVMEMREVKGGLEIPAHGVVTLKPGGTHLMFVGLKHPLNRGDVEHVTLTFAHAGEAKIDVPVAPIGAASPGGGGMMMMKGNKP